MYKNINLLTIFMLLISLMFSGCSKELQDEDIIVMPWQNPEIDNQSSKPLSNAGKYIINQDISPKGIVGDNILNNSMNSNNLRNYYVRPQSKAIINIPIEQKWVDFDALDGLIYLVSNSGIDKKEDTGSKISIYDVDGQQLLKSITADNFIYSGISAYNNHIFLYDRKSCEIHTYTTDLSFKDKFKLGKEIDLVKMAHSKEGWLFMLVNEGGRHSIIAYDKNLSIKSTINTTLLGSKLPFIQSEYKKWNICDFDFYDSNRVIIRVLPDYICLYNFKDNKAESIKKFPDVQPLISFDTNILYSASASLNNLNDMHTGTPGTLARYFLNEDTFKSDINSSMEDYKIPPLDLPSNGLLTFHKKIVSRGKFIYILDYPIDDKNPAESQILVLNK
ncbi:MAG TPA: hypothetical protein VIO64_09825 [Pseudobacteroides sp.]|uniref:hypothetical protein n=1 Tax=Pseudobacteroides sp. TaxID=1968840 RepID=UPI002F9401D9